MDIVVCIDKAFVMPTGVMMYSACVNNQDTDIMFHIVADESVTDKDRKDLIRTVESFKGKHVTFYTLDSRSFSELPALEGNSRLNQSTYYRLFLTEILPNHLDKVLYLDGDLIIRHSLLPIWNTDLSNYAIAAVTDNAESTMSIYERLNYPSQLSYFNAGVLLVNLHYWRSHNVLKTFNSFMQEHRSDIIQHDQDVLNAVFCRQKVILPIKYNATLNFYSRWPIYDFSKYKDEVLEARKDPVIIHYTSEKPWQYCRYPHPLENVFFRYQSQTCWKDWPKEDRRPMLKRMRNTIFDMMRKARLWPKQPQMYVDISPMN